MQTDEAGATIARAVLADLRYFEERAEQEIRRAGLADHPDAARAHALLAGYYLDLVHNSHAAEAGAPAPSGVQVDDFDPLPPRLERQRHSQACSYRTTQSEQGHHGRRP